MVKFTSKPEVAQACMTAIHYNKLRTKISNKKYAKLVKTVEAGYKNGTIESVWKSFKEHKQHMNKREYKQLKKDVKDFVYPECTICCDKNCMENHCTTCKGRDKMVCRGCILKMTKLDEDLNSEIQNVEKEIIELKLSSPKKINSIASNITNEVIKRLIGTDVNESSVSALVEEELKKLSRSTNGI